MNKESHLFLIADYQSSMLWRRVCRIRPSITSYFQDLQPILPLTTSQTLFTPPPPKKQTLPRTLWTKEKSIQTHLENIWRRVFRVRGRRGAVSAVVVVVVRLLIVDGYDLLPVVGHVVEAVVRVEDASVQLLQVVHGHPRVRWLRERPPLVSWIRTNRSRKKKNRKT